MSDLEPRTRAIVAAALAAQKAAANHKAGVVAGRESPAPKAAA